MIAPHTAKGIATAIQDGKAYSLINDESTDLANIKSLAIIVRFYQNGVVRDQFLELVEVADQSANGIFSLVLSTLAKHSLPLNNMIGFAADNASVMMGRSGGPGFIKKTFAEFVCARLCLPQFRPVL